MHAATVRITQFVFGKLFLELLIIDAIKFPEGLSWLFCAVLYCQ